MMKSKQQQFALRIALFILRQNGYTQPPKKQVLNFLQMRRLLQFPDTELQRRRASDHDEIWQNDISWKRKDLFMDGEVGSPEHGHWCLTQAGIDKVERQKANWLKLESEAERETVLSQFEYWTEELINWMLKIAKGESLSLKLDPR